MCNDFPVLCADIGSVKQGNFGWAARWPGCEEMETESDIACFAERLVKAITDSEKVAVGFECPLFVPVSHEAGNLLSKREEDTSSRAWSAGAGPYALAAGLAEITWILREARSRLQEETPPTFLDLDEFRKAGSGILFWEAMVTGEGKDKNAKGNEHARDAKAAIDAFRQHVEQKPVHLDTGETPVFNLLWACLMRAEWVCDAAGLCKPVLVVNAERPTGGDATHSVPCHASRRDAR